jgi:hypothetical protein
MWFEVVDSNDYLSTPKDKFLRRITGRNTMVWRIASNRKKGLVSFYQLDQYKRQWETAVQDGEHEAAYGFLLNTGLRLLTEAQYAEEIDTHAKELRNDYNRTRSSRFEIYQGRKPERNSTFNHPKHRKSYGGDQYNRPHERDDACA